MQFWLSGVQLAAINFQTPGKELQINQGWFLQNGGCGYVLKPSSMTTGCFSTEKLSISTESFLLSISIISGRHLNDISIKKDGAKKKFPTNTLVKVEIIGHPADRAVGMTKVYQVLMVLDYSNIRSAYYLFRSKQCKSSSKYFFLRKML